MAAAALGVSLDLCGDKHPVSSFNANLSRQLVAARGMGLVSMFLSLNLPLSVLSYRFPLTIEKSPDNAYPPVWCDLCCRQETKAWSHGLVSVLEISEPSCKTLAEPEPQLQLRALAWLRLEQLPSL